MRTIIRLAQERPTFYLATHNPESGHRLANAATVRVNEDVRA
jgi:hypothetical protein